MLQSGQIHSPRNEKINSFVLMPGKKSNPDSEEEGNVRMNWTKFMYNPKWNSTFSPFSISLQHKIMLFHFYCSFDLNHQKQRL